jgi:hypothetical protein
MKSTHELLKAFGGIYPGDILGFFKIDKEPEPRCNALSSAISRHLCLR